MLAMLAAVSFSLQARDRWAALAQLESGSNDAAVGAAGEISRYQMKLELWRRFAPPKADWEKPADALAVAKEIMKLRSADFEASFHRPPTDFEFYILWNAPSKIQKPSPVIRKRAERFCNLVASP